jgi:hypothetical protein
MDVAAVVATHLMEAAAAALLVKVEPVELWLQVVIHLQDSTVLVFLRPPLSLLPSVAMHLTATASRWS